MIAILQIYEPFRVGLLITYFGPIVMVTGLTMIKEIWDEYKKGKKDATLNNEKFM